MPDWTTEKKLAYAIWREEGVVSPRIPLFVECLVARLCTRAAADPQAAAHARALRSGVAH